MDRTNLKETFENLAKSSSDSDAYTVYHFLAQTLGKQGNTLEDAIEVAKDASLFINPKQAAAGKASLAILRLAETSGIE